MNLAPRPPTRIGALVLAVLRHPAFVPTVVALHVVLRVLVITLLPAEPDSDAEWYYSRAVDLAAGKGYVKPNGEPTAYWPVGYPAFLAGLFWLFGSDLLFVKLGNLATSLVTLWAMHGFVSRCAGTAAARLAILGYAIYPNAIGHMAIAWTEPLYTMLLVLGCRGYAFAQKPRQFALAGVFFGLATLVKTQTLVLPPFLVLMAFLVHPGARFRGATIRGGLILCLAMALTIAPWTARNWMVFDELVIVNTNGGMHFLVSNNPSLKPDYRTNLMQDDPLVAATGHPHAPELETNRRARRFAMEFIRDNPGHFAQLVPHKLFRLWAPDGESEWAFQANEEFYTPNQTAFRAVRWANQIYYFGVLALAAASVFLARRLRGRPDPWFAIGWWVALNTSLICIVFSGQPRYHAPMMPFLFGYAAVSLVVLLRLPREARDGTPSGAELEPL